MAEPRPPKAEAPGAGGRNHRTTVLEEDTTPTPRLGHRGGSRWPRAPGRRAGSWRAGPPGPGTAECARPSRKPSPAPGDRSAGLASHRRAGAGPPVPATQRRFRTIPRSARRRSRIARHREAVRPEGRRGFAGFEGIGRVRSAGRSPRPQGPSFSSDRSACRPAGRPKAVAGGSRCAAVPAHGGGRRNPGGAWPSSRRTAEPLPVRRRWSLRAGRGGTDRRRAGACPSRDLRPEPDHRIFVLHPAWRTGAAILREPGSSHSRAG